MDVAGDIVCLIGFLIYLEIIELKFFGLNYNLRKYIMQRGIDNDYSILSINIIKDEEISEDDTSNQTDEVSSELKEK